MVHQNRSHSYQHIIVYCAAVNDRPMGNRHIIADIYRRLPVSAMDYYAILDVDIFPYPDIMNIAANHRIEPDTAIIPENYITDNRSIIRDEAPFANIW